MVATFRPDARRDAAAHEIAEGAPAWLQIRLRRQHGAFPTGTKFYGVPSSKGDGSYYYTNLKICSCADYERRGSGCKHQRAVALHVERVRAVRTRPEQPSPVADAVETLFDGVDGIKALFGDQSTAIVQTYPGTRYDAIFSVED